MGMWMVTGTTRSKGDASIITGSGAPERCARNSVWPGKAKPAPSLSAFLLIGLVQSASAAPLRTNSTPRAMMAMTAPAFSGSARPGSGGRGSGCGSTGSPAAMAAAASAGAAIGRTGMPRRAPSAAMWSGSPIRKKGRRSRSAPQALSAISGPIPAGSPSVSATGRVIARR